MADVRLLRQGDRFYVRADTDDGRRWVRRVMASDAESISVEFLADYEQMLGAEGLSYEITKCA